MGRRGRNRTAGTRRWARIEAHGEKFEPVRPSLWEQELRRLHVSEAGAAQQIERGTEVGKALRRFVLIAAYQHYVPEAVLAVLGLGSQVQRVQESLDDRGAGLRKLRLVKMLGEEAAK